jgi:hypothetical protein
MKKDRKSVKSNINNNMTKKSNKKLSENANISHFLKSISQKNYSQANKYLQSVIDSKLKTRIGEALKQKLF